MAGFLFQWIRGVFTSQGKRRRPRTVKPSRRDAYLHLEQLEDRRLFSVTLFMSQGLNPVGGTTQNNYALQMFQPIIGAPQSALQQFSSASIYLAGNMSLVETGLYTLSIYEAGSATGMGSFVFRTSGAVTYSLNELGTSNNAGYSTSSLVLSQTASLSWSYVQTNGGMTMANQSGTDAISTTSLGTTVLDPDFWQGMNWYDPLKKLMNNHTVLSILGTSATSFSITETASESFGFTVNSQETLTGTGTQPVADLQEPGSETAQRPRPTPSANRSLTATPAATRTRSARAAWSPCPIIR